MVDFKYKVTDIAKDFGISTKKVIETFAELTGETRKTGATFEENEVNALMEALTRETAVKDLGEYLASGKEPQPVKQETKKPEAKPQVKKKRRSRRPLSPSPSSRKPPRQSRKRSRPSPPRMRSPKQHSPRQHSPNRSSRKSAMISVMITSRPKSAAKSA